MRILIGAIAALLAFAPATLADTPMCDKNWSERETQNFNTLLQLFTRHNNFEQATTAALATSMGHEHQRWRIRYELARRAGRVLPKSDQKAPVTFHEVGVAFGIVTPYLRRNPPPPRATIVQAVVNSPLLRRFLAATRQQLADMAIVEATRAIRDAAARYEKRLNARDCANGLLTRFDSRWYTTGATAPAICGGTCSFSGLKARVDLIAADVRSLGSPHGVTLSVPEDLEDPANISTVIRDMERVTALIIELRDGAARIAAVVGAFFDDINAITTDIRTAEFVYMRIISPLAPHRDFALLRGPEFDAHVTRANSAIAIVRNARDNLPEDQRPAEVVRGLGELIAVFRSVAPSVEAYRVESFPANLIAAELLQISGTPSQTRTMIAQKRDGAQRAAPRVFDEAESLASLLP